jgi:multiple sugar transport system substrate-binding protein
MNAISVLRTLEEANPELAADTGIALIPEGPVQRLGLEHVLGVYVIWKFSKKKDLAAKFLVDLAVNYKDAFVESKFYNFPSFPASVPNLDQLVSDDPVSQPPDKLAILADAEKVSTNVGHPGTVNAAIDELFNQFLIPQMFAQAAREEMTPEEAVKAADGQIKDIYDKWRDQGKI